MHDLVSIITPTYNCERYIEETIQSVLSQTYTNWEMIVYDDASIDGTKKIIGGYVELDSRIKYFRNDINCGAAITRNKALQQTKGRWIAFLDSDDVWLPCKLENQVRFMEEHQYHFSYHDYVEIDENLNELGIWVSGPNKISKMGMYSRNWLGCLSVMYDREYIGLIQIDDIKRYNDYVLWLHIIQKSDCFRLKECLAKYRRREGSISPKSFKDKLYSLYLVFRYGVKLNSIYSLWWTCVNLVCHIVKKLLYTKRYETIG